MPTEINCLGCYIILAIVVVFPIATLIGLSVVGFVFGIWKGVKNVIEVFKEARDKLP